MLALLVSSADVSALEIISPIMAVFGGLVFWVTR